MESLNRRVSKPEKSCAPVLMRVRAGLALLHPDLSGSLGPSMTRLLARSKLGRSILRPLLRTEVGEVANPRAWYNPEKLTPEVGTVAEAQTTPNGTSLACRWADATLAPPYSDAPGREGLHHPSSPAGGQHAISVGQCRHAAAAAAAAVAAARSLLVACHALGCLHACASALECLAHICSCTT